MKQPLFMILFLVFALWGMVRAHTGIGVTKNYGHICVLSYKEVEVEEFRKAFIIGQLAEKLADEIQCTDSIYLDFLHNFCKDERLPTAYHVSVEQVRDWSKMLKTGGEKIIIRQYANQYDIEATLKLLEYAMKNREQIKQQQTMKRNPELYGVRSFLSISDTEINQILQQPNSTALEAVLQTRVDRPLLDPNERPSAVSYYWQNNTFYIFQKKRLKGKKEPTDAVIAKLPHIHTFHPLYPMTVVFDRDDSFYFIHPNHRDPATGNYACSQRQVIKGATDVIWWKKVSAISHDDIAIHFRDGLGGQGTERLLLYFSNADTLIQDAYSLADPSIDPIARLHTFEDMAPKRLIGDFTTWKKQLDFLKPGGKESAIGSRQLTLISYTELGADDSLTIDAFKGAALEQTVSAIRNGIPFRRSKNENRHVQEKLDILRKYQGPENDLRLVKLTWLFDQKQFNTYAVVSAFHDSIIYDDIISYTYSDTKRLRMLRIGNGLRYSEWSP